MFNHSRRRLARSFTLSMGLILVTFAGLVYWREVRDRIDTLDRALYSTSQVMIGGVEVTHYQGQQHIDLEDMPLLGDDSRFLNTELHFARWYTTSKTLVQFFGPIPPPRLTDQPGLITRGAEQTPAGGRGDRLRQLTLPVYQNQILIGYLQIATSLHPIETQLQKLRWFLAIGVPITLGAIASVGWILGGIAMQPIRVSYQNLQQFTADASHELRNPLAGIINHAHVALMEPIDPQEQTMRLETIATIATTMGNLVSQLLFLARQNGELPAHQRQRINGATLLQTVIEAHHDAIATKRLTLHTQFPAEPVWLWVEPDLWQQAIANLLSNACRYTDSGGTLTLTLARHPRWAVITVADTGIGIASADQTAIFKRFYRVDAARSAEGFGLGLAITEQIITAHQGKITVLSHPGQGTCFTIRVPLAPDHES